MTKEALAKNIEAAMKSNEFEGHVYTDEEKAIFSKVKNGEMTLEEAHNHFIEELKAR